jgi:hypothetical protein
VSQHFLLILLFFLGGGVALHERLVGLAGIASSSVTEGLKLTETGQSPSQERQTWCTHHPVLAAYQESLAQPD